MALIPCPDCGKEFSDQAKKCPNCHRPTPISTDAIILKIIIGVVLLIIILGMAIELGMIRIDK
jgi:predicted amidophosphoribosyltransferase